MPANLYDQAIEALEASKASMRCADLTDWLSRLGFEIRDGSRGGHKIFIHDGLAAFHSGSYNCDHGRNPQIKRPYIVKVLRALREHEADLKKFLGDNS